MGCANVDASSTRPSLYNAPKSVSSITTPRQVTARDTIAPATRIPSSSTSASKRFAQSSAPVTPRAGWNRSTELPSTTGRIDFSAERERSKQILAQSNARVKKVRESLAVSAAVEAKAGAPRTTRPRQTLLRGTAKSSGTPSITRKDLPRHLPTAVRTPLSLSERTSSVVGASYSPSTKSASNINTSTSPLAPSSPGISNSTSQSRNRTRITATSGESDQLPTYSRGSTGATLNTEKSARPFIASPVSSPVISSSVAPTTPTYHGLGSRTISPADRRLGVSAASKEVSVTSSAELAMNTPQSATGGERCFSSRALKSFTQDAKVSPTIKKVPSVENQSDYLATQRRTQVVPSSTVPPVPPLPDSTVNGFPDSADKSRANTPRDSRSRRLSTYLQGNGPSTEPRRQSRLFTTASNEKQSDLAYMPPLNISALPSQTISRVNALQRAAEEKNNHSNQEGEKQTHGLLFGHFGKNSADPDKANESKNLGQHTKSGSGSSLHFLLKKKSSTYLDESSGRNQILSAAEREVSALDTLSSHLEVSERYIGHEQSDQSKDKLSLHKDMHATSRALQINSSSTPLLPPNRSYPHLRSTPSLGSMRVSPSSIPVLTSIPQSKSMSKELTLASLQPLDSRDSSSFPSPSSTFDSPKKSLNLRNPISIRTRLGRTFKKQTINHRDTPEPDLFMSSPPPISSPPPLPSEFLRRQEEQVDGDTEEGTDHSFKSTPSITSIDSSNFRKPKLEKSASVDSNASYSSIPLPPPHMKLQPPDFSKSNHSSPRGSPSLKLLHLAKPKISALVERALSSVSSSANSSTTDLLQFQMKTEWIPENHLIRDEMDQAADEEMRQICNRNSKMRDSARELAEYRRNLGVPTDSMTVSLAVKTQSLNLYEKGEILDFREVFFCGRKGCQKVNGDLTASAINFGFDDDKGDYQLVVGDHLAYRYEILGLLGKGSFGQVAKCVDHKTGVLVAVKIIRSKRRFHSQALVETKILNDLKKWVTI